MLEIVRADRPVIGQVAFGQGYPGRWAGKGIWTKGEARPYHAFLMVRRSLQLEGAPRAARLHITAADRYLLYVNGAYLGRGPARSDPRWTSYDTYDVASSLHAGKNTKYDGPGNLEVSQS